MTALRLLVATLVLGSAAGTVSGQSFKAEFLLGASRADFRSAYLQESWREGVSSQDWTPVWTGSRLAPVIGIGLSRNILGPFSLRGALLAVGKGLSSPGVEYKATYIEAPILVELTAPWREPVTLRAVVGIAPGAEIACSAEAPGPVDDWFGQSLGAGTRDCSDFRSSRTDVSRVYGAGFGPLTLFGFSLFPEVRFVSGRSIRRADYADRFRERHRAWSLVLAVAR